MFPDGRLHLSGIARLAQLRPTPGRSRALHESRFLSCAPASRPPYAEEQAPAARSAHGLTQAKLSASSRLPEPR
jgi:hypothetical protein